MIGFNETLKESFLSENKIALEKIKEDYPRAFKKAKNIIEKYNVKEISFAEYGCYDKKGEYHLIEKKKCYKYRIIYLDEIFKGKIWLFKPC